MTAAEPTRGQVIVLRPRTAAAAPPRRRVAAVWAACAAASWAIAGLAVYGSYFAVLAVLDVLRG